MPDWMVDWFSDSLAALFAVDVTDIGGELTQCMTEWLTDLVTL